MDIACSQCGARYSASFASCPGCDGSPPSDWTPKGPWAHIRGNQTITKAISGGGPIPRGEPVYQVWHGDELQATPLKSFEAAVEVADFLLKTSPKPV
jgi:hypothetical protein